MFSHLKSEEFVNLLEGITLEPRRIAHLDGCLRCSEALESISETYRDVANECAKAGEVDIPDIDWHAVRPSVRNQLLKRSVKRTTTVQRWTGWRLTPSAAWGMGFALLLTVALFASFTGSGSMPEGIPAVARVDTGSADDGLTFYMDEAEATQAEAMAWAETEIFTALNELEAEETELLRELVASAYDEEIGIDGGLYR